MWKRRNNDSWRQLPLNVRGSRNWSKYRLIMGRARSSMISLAHSYSTFYAMVSSIAWENISMVYFYTIKVFLMSFRSCPNWEIVAAATTEKRKALKHENVIWSLFQFQAISHNDRMRSSHHSITLATLIFTTRYTNYTFMHQLHSMTYVYDLCGAHNRSLRSRQFRMICGLVYFTILQIMPCFIEHHLHICLSCIFPSIITPSIRLFIIKHLVSLSFPLLTSFLIIWLPS